MHTTTTSRLLSPDETDALGFRYELDDLAQRIVLRFRALGQPAAIMLKAHTLVLAGNQVEIEVDVNYRIVRDDAVASGVFRQRVRGNTVSVAFRNFALGLYEAITAQIGLMAFAAGIDARPKVSA